MKPENIKRRIDKRAGSTAAKTVSVNLLFDWKRISGIYFLLLIVIVCLASYYSSLSNDFVWDDRGLIVQDKKIKHLGNILQVFNRDFFDFSEDEKVRYGYFRPLVTISYMLDYAVWGKNPWGFHLTNLIVHIICTILIFVIFLELGVSLPLSLAGSLIFGVHPVHTETVSWISGRTDLLCAWFLLFALWYYLAYRQQGETRFLSIPPQRAYILSLFFYLLSLLSKEMGVVLIFIIPVLEKFHLSNNEKEFSWKKVFVKSSPYWALTILFFVWHSFVVHRLDRSVENLQWEYLYSNSITFFKAFWFYLYKLVWPARLSVYIQLPMLKEIFEGGGIYYLGFFLIFIYFLTFKTRSKPLVGISGWWFLVSLIPLSNFFRITSPADMGFTLAERFMYIPSIGFIFFIMGLLAWWNEFFQEKFPAPSRGWFPLIASVIVITALGYRTFLRNRQWKTDETLFLTELSYNTKASLIYANLAIYYADNNQHKSAMYYYMEALELEPDSVQILCNLGRILVDMGDFQEATTYLEKALEYNTEAFKVHNNLGLANAGLGRYRTAIQYYRNALRLRQESSEIHNNLGVSYKNIGKFQEALYEYNEAIKLDKEYASPYKNKAIVYINFLKKPKEGSAALRKSLEVDPHQPEAAMMADIIRNITRSLNKRSK